MVWILPDYSKDYMSQPLAYFTHLFGHEGEHSLLSYLKEHDLAMSLNVYASVGELNGVFSDLTIDIVLTKNGYSKW
jgi:secreted Zn-dependent insulinase-like peptidase